MVACSAFECRLAGYALAAGAAVVAADPVQAAIVYTDLDPDLVFTLGAGPQSYGLDLNDDAQVDFSLFFYSISWGGVNGANIHYDGLEYGIWVDPAVGNEVLGDVWTARALNSNYLLSQSASTWVEDPNPRLAWRGSRVYSTGEVEPWDGGYFLGRNRKLLGLHFDTWHYGWCRISVDREARLFTVHDYAYDSTLLASIPAGAYLPSILEGTVGNRVELAAANVPDVGAAFAAPPKVVGFFFDPVKGKKVARATFKGVLNGDASAMVLEVRKKIRLYDAKAFKVAYRTGTICRDFLHDQPNQGMYFDLEVTHEVGGVDQSDRCVHLALMPPEITGTVGAFALGNLVTVNGTWFGVKPPKAWLEYTVLSPKGGALVKSFKLKVSKPYIYANAKGKLNASCMNVDTGESAIRVLVPTAWPDGFNPESEHCLVLDNGIGLATRLVIDP